LDLTQPWEIEIEFPHATPGNGVVVKIDDVADTYYAWDAGNPFIIGAFHYDADKGSGGLYVSMSAPGVTLIEPGPLTFPRRVKMARSGANDVTFSATSQMTGAFPAPFYTAPNRLAGFTTGYIKGLFTAPAAPQGVIVRLKQG